MYKISCSKVRGFSIRLSQQPSISHRSQNQTDKTLRKTPESIPTIRFKRTAFTGAMNEICSKPPETGGILLGPVETDHVITDFYFDKGANCSGSTYSPDHVTLSKLLKEKWGPQNVDFKGFIHSHPNAFDRLSDGDLVYISRLLKRNVDMSMFIAPIIIPDQFRMSTYVVLRDKLDQPQQPRVIFF